MVPIRKYLLRDIHLKELFKGSSIAFSFKIFSVLIGYVFFYVLAKKFGAIGLGIFNTCFTVLILTSVIAKLGLDTALVKYIAEYVVKDNKQQIGKLYLVSLSFIFIVGAFVSLLIYFFSKELSILFFENSNQGHLFRIIGFTIVPFSITQLNSEYFRGFKKITAYSVLQNGTVYFIILVLIFLASQYYSNIDFLIYSLFITSVFLMLLSTFFVLKNNFTFRFNNITDLKNHTGISKRQLISVSIPMLFSNSLFFVMTWTDTLMLSAFHSEDVVGVYNIALKIASLNTIALIAINSIASPKFSEIYSSEGIRRFKRIVQQTTIISWLVSAPIFAIILIYPESVLKVFGQEFLVGRNALIILSIGQLVSAFSGSTMIVLNMTGREKIGRNILIVTAIINILINFLLIPRYGIIGAAIATMVSTVFWNLVSVLFIYRSFGFLTFPTKRKKI
ncbi:MAG: flippase [Bacteroidales bacterium]|nr:flippase [Bacteroidales bacterium]